MTRTGDCLMPACDCIGQCRRLGKTEQQGPISQTLEAWNDKLCPYCATKMHVDSISRYPTRDHIEPLGLGGLNIAANKVVCCRVCNSDKGCRTLKQFYEALLEADDDRAATVARFMRMRLAAPVCMNGDALSADQVASVMRILVGDAQARAESYGLQIAICAVTVHGDQVRAYTTPFEADTVQSWAVAHQMAEQAERIREQATSIREHIISASVQARHVEAAE